MTNPELVDTPFVAKDQVEYAAGSIVSKEILHSDAGSITYFAFDRGQALSPHSAQFDAFVQLLDGEAWFNVDGKDYHVRAGQTFIMPANILHGVTAIERFKMSLTMIKGKWCEYSIPQVELNMARTADVFSSAVRFVL